MGFGEKRQIIINNEIATNEAPPILKCEIVHDQYTPKKGSKIIKDYMGGISRDAFIGWP